MEYSSLFSISLHPPYKELHKREENKKKGGLNKKILPKLGKIDLSKVNLRKHLEIPVLSARKMLNMFSKYIQDFH